MTRAYLALGSNLGDRLAHLQFAVDALAAADGVDVVAVSRVYETAPVGGPPQDAYLNAVVAIDTDLDPHALLALAQRIERDAQRVRAERWGPRTLDVDVLLVRRRRVSTIPTSPFPHPRMWERGFVLAPLRDVAPELVDADAAWEGVREAAVTLRIPWRNEQRTVALIGPGRAGTTIALGLVEQGWTVVGVGGRAPDAPSTAAAAACLASRPALVSEVARGAALVIVATPDRAIEQVLLDGRAGDRARRARRAPRGFARARRVRAAARPADRRAGRRAAPAAVVPVGDDRARAAAPARGRRSRAIPQVAEIARALGLRPFELADADRGRYHAAAVVASNHLVALLGQVERLAATCARAVRGVRAARARLGAERVRARSRRRAHRAGRPRRPRDGRAAPPRPRSRPSATRTGPSRGRPPG